MSGDHDPDLRTIIRLYPLALPPMLFPTYVQHLRHRASDVAIRHEARVSSLRARMRNPPTTRQRRLRQAFVRCNRSSSRIHATSHPAHASDAVHGNARRCDQSSSLSFRKSTRRFESHACLSLAIGLELMPSRRVISVATSSLLLAFFFLRYSASFSEHPSSDATSHLFAGTLSPLICAVATASSAAGAGRGSGSGRGSGRGRGGSLDASAKGRAAARRRSLILGERGAMELDTGGGCTYLEDLHREDQDIAPADLWWRPTVAVAKLTGDVPAHRRASRPKHV